MLSSGVVEGVVEQHAPGWDGVDGVPRIRSQVQRGDVILGTNVMEAALSTNLDDPSAIPYFLWDEPMTVAELRRRLANASAPEQTRLLAKILREARDTDVWRFTTPEEVVRRWPELSLHLGRRRVFWEFLLGQWRRMGLLVP